MNTFTSGKFTYTFGNVDESLFTITILNNSTFAEYTWHWFDIVKARELFDSHHIFQNIKIMEKIMYDGFVGEQNIKLMKQAILDGDIKPESMDGWRQNIVIKFNEETKEMTIDVDLMYVKDSITLAFFETEFSDREKDIVKRVEDKYVRRVEELEYTITRLRKDFVLIELVQKNFKKSN